MTRTHTHTLGLYGQWCLSLNILVTGLYAFIFIAVFHCNSLLSVSMFHLSSSTGSQYVCLLKLNARVVERGAGYAVARSKTSSVMTLSAGLRPSMTVKHTNRKWHTGSTLIVISVSRCSQKGCLDVRSELWIEDVIPHRIWSQGEAAERCSQSPGSFCCVSEQDNAFLVGLVRCVLDK